MTRGIPRRATIARVFTAAAIPCVFMLATSQPAGVRAQPAAAAAPVGTGTTGQTVWEFVGQIDQVGGSFVGYGYLTRVAGVPTSALLPNPISHTESSARLTFSMHASLLSRSVVGNVFVLDAAATMSFHLQASGGASFTTPASFARGPLVSSFSGTLQGVTNVQAPNMGITQVWADLRETRARDFVLGGHRYQFGKVGLLERLTATGEGTRLDPTVPRATYVMAANATIA